MGKLADRLMEALNFDVVAPEIRERVQVEIAARCADLEIRRKRDVEIVGPNWFKETAWTLQRETIPWVAGRYLIPGGKPVIIADIDQMVWMTFASRLEVD